MTHVSEPTPRRKLPLALSHGELAGLIELCKLGMLFEVQDWIAQKKPVELAPKSVIPLRDRRSPLQIAVDSGFYSLVQVLVEAGQSEASLRFAMSLAIAYKRIDLIKLLVKHGVKPSSIDMRPVFEIWDPDIIAYFIENGADLEANKPFLFAFENRVQTSLLPFKEQAAKNPRLIEQANIALRKYAKTGNEKWTSLLLWAGADPNQPGTVFEDGEWDEVCDSYSAVEIAAMYGRYDLFKSKKFLRDPKSPALERLVLWFAQREYVDLLNKLIQMGVNLNMHHNGGCETLLSKIRSLHRDTSDKDGSIGIDNRRATESMAMIELLAAHGGKWVCEDDGASERSSLMKMAPWYTLEFVRIMATHKACSLIDVKHLFKPSSLMKRIQKLWPAIEQILEHWDQMPIDLPKRKAGKKKTGTVAKPSSNPGPTKIISESPK